MKNWVWRTLLVTCIISASCNSQSKTTSEEMKMLQLREEAHRNEIAVRASFDDVLDTIATHRQQLMGDIRAARREGKIADSQWLNIQATDRNLVDTLSSARAANRHGDDSQVIELQRYMFEQLDELRSVAIELAKKEDSADDLTIEE